MTNKLITPTSSRRTLLKGMAAGGALLATGLGARFAQAQSSAPIKLGFQLHRTGIGAAYGRWYERTAQAALKAINRHGSLSMMEIAKASTPVSSAKRAASAGSVPRDAAPPS